MLSETLLEENPPLQSAIVGAFALIAAADGEAHAMERDKLESWLAQGEVATERREAMLVSYGRLCDDLLAGKSEPRTRALAEIKEAAGDALHRDLLLSAGRAAMVADEHIDASEEVTIREVAEKLGIDPDVA